MRTIEWNSHMETMYGTFPVKQRKKLGRLGCLRKKPYDFLHEIDARAFKQGKLEVVLPVKASRKVERETRKKKREESERLAHARTEANRLKRIFKGAPDLQFVD